MADPIEFQREALPPNDAIERQWRDLERAASPSFFTSWHWIGTLLAAVPPASRPTLLRGSLRGETVALALLGQRLVRRRGGLICSRTLSLNEADDPRSDMTIEHNGLLVVPGHEAAALDALIAWFAGHGAESDELLINGSRQRLPDAAVERRGLGRSEIELPAYSVELARLARSDGELHPVLSANARQQLRRAIRHYQRFGELQLTPAATPAEAQTFFGELKQLHAAAWERRGQPHSFTRECFEPFHRLLIERSFAAGTVQMLRATAGEQLIGYLYNFRFGDRVYAYQSGFAYDDRAARPGAVAHALAIRQACRCGVEIYDFLAGYNRLKESFATRIEPMFWQTIQQPRLGFRLEHLARAAKHRIAGVLNGPLRCRKVLLQQPQKR